ncbi:MAG: hypothetical protein V4580_02720 [Bacteroidota bacterium]
MKKIALLTFIAFTFFGCTRKQTLVEPEGTLAEYNDHCYNGLLDGDEISIDCGGECGPCNFATPSCSPGTNTLKIGASTYAIAGTSCGNPSSQFEMDGAYIDGSVTIEIGENAPDLTAEYDIINSVPLSHQASIHFTSGSYGGLNLYSGKLYFSQVGGKYIATICNGMAHSFVTGVDYSITANFSCP